MVNQSLVVPHPKSLEGSIRPPSDKSLTHRAFLLASLCDGQMSRIVRPLLGDDCLSTIDCLTDLGLDIEVFEDGEFDLDPFALVKGRNFWDSPDVDLNCGNSGTTMRLLAGLLASQPGMVATLTGDASLSKRPMKRIAEPLQLMGAVVEGQYPPLKISGRFLQSIDYISTVASAQIKSCILLAGLRANGETWVTEPTKSRDHTERMLSAMGVEILRDGPNRVGVSKTDQLSPIDFEVPADISSAAYWIVAGALFEGSRVELTDVGLNQTRTGILDVMNQAGVEIEINNEHESSGEPLGNLLIKGSGNLKPFSIDAELVPRLIDEIPVLCVLATQCEGTSIVRGARELRVKESDRIETIASGLSRMGAEVETFEDGLAITGPTLLNGSTIDSEGDHRIGMTFAIAGLIAKGTTTILNSQCIETSYPQFETHLAQLTVM